MTQQIPSTGGALPAPRNVRSAILGAASRLFSERGYAATSVREVVESAGCKKPTLYYYFRSKEHLYLEVLQGCASAISDVVEAELKQPGPVRERFRRGLGAYMAYVREHPTHLRLLMTAERHPEQGQPFYDFDGLRQTYIDRTRSVLNQGVAAGELRADVDYDEAVLALFGMVDQRLVLFLHGRELPADFPDSLLDIFFNGVSA